MTRRLLAGRPGPRLRSAVLALGLIAVAWSAPASVAAAGDRTAPHVSAPVVRIRSVVGFGTVAQVSVAVTGTDTGSGLGDSVLGPTFYIAVSRNGGSYATIKPTTVQTIGIHSPVTFVINRSLALTGTYRFRAKMRDRAGNWSGWMTGPVLSARIIQDSSTTMRYSAGWSPVLNAQWSGGSVRSSVVAGSTAVLSFTGRGIGWVTHRDPESGLAEVWIDGTLQATVDLYNTSPTTLDPLVVFSKTWGSSGLHKIAIKVLGTGTHPKIDHDAFLILR